METYTLAPLLLCLKGFPSRLLRLSKYVAELWVFTAGSSPLYETKPPPIDTQASSRTERLVSDKENVCVICYKIYFNKLRSRRPGKRDSTPGKGRYSIPRRIHDNPKTQLATHVYWGVKRQGMKLTTYPYLPPKS